jgi:ABC-2 type transport system permease protein
MTDAWTVTVKELIELLSDRSSRRGVLVQAILVTVALGVLVPRSTAQQWLVDSPDAILLFLLLPPVIAGSLGADAFAGERERRTLETLLATPLSDRAVVAGKALAALTAAIAVTVVSLIAAVITVNVAAAPPAMFVPSWTVCGGALFGAIASSCVTTAMAIGLSLRTTVARAVQQMVSLGFVVPVALGASLAERAGFAFTWPHVFELELLAVIVGLGGLAVTAARFHRDRLFVKR